VRCSSHGIASQHAVETNVLAISSHLLPMSSDIFVTHVPGLDLALAHNVSCGT